MKFFLLFGLLTLIVSCYAACDCSAADQPCLDKCVTSANSCVVKCQKDNAGESCEQACFAANWPSMTSVNVNVLSKITSMAATAGATGSSAAAATPTPSKPSASMPASAGVTASVARPSTGASPSLKPTVNNNSTSGADIHVSFGWASLVMAVTAVGFYLL